MAIARSRGKLKGRQPKLSPRQQAGLVRMHASGDRLICLRKPVRPKPSNAAASVD
jgi:hypothetical protein